MIRFDYVRPTGVEEASRAGTPDWAAFLVGGTNLVDLMKENVARPLKLVDINRLPLGEITELDDGGLRLGALVTNSRTAYAAEYHLAVEHHMQMEMHASAVHWHGDGKVTIYDKVQGSQTSQELVASAFGLGGKNVRVVNAFVGGGSGGGLRPQWQLHVAIMASIHLERSVRVVMTRSQMSSHEHRPECTYQIRLGAEADGKLAAALGDATTSTSRFGHNMAA